MPGLIGSIGNAEVSNAEFAGMAEGLKRQRWITTQSCQIQNGTIGISSLPTQVERQPVSHDAQGVSCVLQGYLTNRESLLSRFGFDPSYSDSKIVAEGFKACREEIFAQIDGSFNLAVYDSRDKATYLVTDCYGHLTMNFAFDSSHFAFGPELKCFKNCTWLPRETNWKAVSEYLVYGQPWNDRTFIKNVYNLQPGTFVKWQNGSCKISRYWRIPYRYLQLGDMSGKALSDQLNTHLENAIRKIPKFNKRLGLFLSGGFDSRIIACYMTRHFGTTFDALGMQFNDEPAVDSIVSTRIAKSLKLEWKPINYRIRDAEKLFDEHLNIHDGTWPCSYFPQALPCEELANTYSHIVNGNNGNHLFGDYATRYYMEENNLLARGVDVDFFKQSGGDGVARSVIFSMMSGSMKLTTPLLNPDFANQAVVEAANSFDQEFHACPDLTGANKYEYLAVTQTGRRYGLFNPPLQDYFEGINPLYHNRELISFMSGLPREWKFSRTLDAQNSSQQFPEVFSHPKISGYPSYLKYSEQVIPSGRRVDDYYDGAVIFKNELSPRIDAIFNDPKFKKRTWMNHSVINELWTRHKSGQQDHSAALSTIIALNYFLDTFTAD